MTALGFLALVSSPATAQSSDPHPPHHGRVSGVWKLPNADALGKAKGVLIEYGVVPRFVLKADLIPVSPPGGPVVDGLVKGHLYRITADGVSDKPFAVVLGKWVGSPDGKGVFETKIFRKKPNGNGLRVIGKMAGHYKDLAGQKGRFKGHWKIH